MPAEENLSAVERKDDELIVFLVRRPAKCDACNAEIASGAMLHIDRNKRALCIDCSGLDQLTFLPSGDVAVTRRASKYSAKRAVVVEWARRRNRYERQGILVEASAIARAREECSLDASKREQNRHLAAEKRAVVDQQYIKLFAAAVRAQFPNAPKDVEHTIAVHACEKYSGRVGRTASAKELDAEKVKLAVIAHIRHVHTNYEKLIAMYNDKQMARDAIREKVDQVLEKWTSG